MHLPDAVEFVDLFEIVDMVSECPERKPCLSLAVPAPGCRMDAIAVAAAPDRGPAAVLPGPIFSIISSLARVRPDDVDEPSPLAEERPEDSDVPPRSDLLSDREDSPGSQLAKKLTNNQIYATEETAKCPYSDLI